MWNSTSSVSVVENGPVPIRNASIAKKLTRFCLVILAGLATLASLIRPLGAFQTDSTSLEIPFEYTQENLIVVSARINDSERVRLMLHTASSELHLTEEAVRKTRNIQFTKQAEVEAWGGDSISRISPNNSVQIGELVRHQIRIWENKLSGPETDGKFGLDFFGDRVLEIDFGSKRLVAQRQLPEHASQFVRLDLTGEPGQWMLDASCIIDNQAHEHRFLIHTGYSGGLLLDDEFVSRIKADSAIVTREEKSLKDAFGHVLKVKSGVLPKLAIGPMELTEVPVGFFSGGKGAQRMSVLGAEVLCRFHIIFDLANRHLYLAPREVR